MSNVASQLVDATVDVDAHRHRVMAGSNVSHWTTTNEEVCLVTQEIALGCRST